MTPDDAARFLRERFRRTKWFTTVIVGERNDGPTLLLYVRTLHFREASVFAAGWQGYPVELRRFPMRVPGRVLPPRRLPFAHVVWQPSRAVLSGQAVCREHSDA